jgi:hypothetical protein
VKPPRITQLAHVHVPGELGAIGHDHVAAHDAIVGDVHVGHDPVVVPKAGDAEVLHRAAVDGAALADRVAVADLHPGGLAGVFLVLRFVADGCKLEDAVVAADGRVAGDHGVRPDRGSVPDADVLADHRVGAHRHARAELRGGVHDGGRMDHEPTIAETSLMVHMRLASATSAPSTLASASYFQMPRSWRSSFAVMISWSPAVTGFLKRALSMPTK